MRNVYHGVLINAAFDNPHFPEIFKIFAKRTDGNWILYGIEIEEDELPTAVFVIQDALRENKPFYAHLYNNKNIFVIFKKRFFTLKLNPSKWHEAIDYGRQLGIPKKQLDFRPNRFENETEYFKIQ